MPAIAIPAAEIVVVADADVWCEGVELAVEAVEDGAGWAIPHQRVLRLTKEATVAYMAGADPVGLPLVSVARKGYVGRRGGGIVVGRREALLEVPLDPRFTGWGQEDESWGLALETILGQPWRGDDPLVHLYHPPATRLDRQWGSREGRQLHRRYANAKRHPNAMRILLREARCSLPR